MRMRRKKFLMPYPKSMAPATRVLRGKKPRFLLRRTRHLKWEKPRFFGMPWTDRPKTLNTGCFSVQHPVLTDSFRTVCPNILLVALAKREEELYIERKGTPIRLKKMPPEVMHFFQHIRDESHRFAKKYHHKL